MRFDIISIFPEAFTSYFDVSILRRAREDGKIDIHIHNLRDYTHDKHKTVDDTPYGGGAGMVMKAEPFFEAVKEVTESRITNQEFPTPHPAGAGSSRRAGEHDTLSSSSTFQGEGREGFELKTRMILFSAKGKLFTQKDAKRLAEYERLIFLCGRYEGVDERVAEHLVDEELSIGEYVLTGGELPAMIVIDAVTRLLPGVLGNETSILDESHSEEGVLEYPQYTKPEEFRGWNVPQVLLSGHHAEIEKWRKSQSDENSKK